MTDDGGYEWASEPEGELYKKAVRICLVDRRLTELLEQRPTVTAEVVVEAMCSPSRVQAVTGGIPLTFLTHYRAARRISDRFRWALPEHLSPSGIRENRKFLPWIAGVLAFCTVTAALFLSSLPAYVVLGVPLFLFFAPGLAFARPSPPSALAPGAPGGWVRAVRLALLGPVTLGLWLLEWRRGAAWIDQVYFHGLHAEVVHTVEELIGDDLGTLLVTGSDEGLRSQHQMSYVVSGRAARQLNSKMNQLADGTIAVSGPRGVGKTTLMRGAVRSRDFSVFAHAPAAYAPHEFLISLFISACREYITRAGHDAPELVRLSYLHRARRTVVEPLRGLLRPLPYALPAALLVGLGLFAVTKESVEREHGVWGWPYVSDGLERLGDFAQDILHGRAPAAAFVLALVGGFLWVLRHSRSFPRLVGGFGRTAVEAVSFGLIVAPLVSLVLDPDVRDHFSGTDTEQMLPLFGLAVLLVAAWLAAAYYHLEPSFDPPRWHVGIWAVDWKWCLGLFTLLWPFLMLALIAVDGTTRPLLTDDETPFRLGAVLIGITLRKLLRRSWSPPRLAPPLVTACRNHLYRLQTVQNSTAGMTTSATRFLTLGTSHTSGVTSVPPNYPLLVAEFRELLGLIAQDEHDTGNRVVIAIDEVDRLGTDAQALAFLAEIKGILGVPHVHYLISVAEDVGAAFVRRGLPNRDVTDSSLDDVLHVMPGTLRESTDILKRRARGIGDAHSALAHALSGGIPRDLIRYGRRLVEVRANREQSELHQVAHTLITEELSETLAGFRTLLAKQQWDRDTMSVLGSFRTLVAHLRATCPCPEPDRHMRLALTHFAAQETAGLPVAESRQLIAEAAAYAYFSLTLLDVFGQRDFTARRTAAAQHADGHLDLLAEARQELGVSPFSALTLIDDIRRAWGLAPVTAQGSLPPVVIPAPRGTVCTWHPRRW